MNLHGRMGLFFQKISGNTEMFSFTISDYLFNLAEPASPKKRPLEEMAKEEPAPKQLKTENGDGDQ